MTLAFFRRKARPPKVGRSINRSERMNRILYVTLALVVVTMIAVTELFIQSAARDAGENHRDHARTQCLEAWADRYTERAQLITEAQRTRNKAQDTFILGLANAHTKTESRQLFMTYLAAVREYNDTQAKNPVPASPRLVC